MESWRKVWREGVAQLLSLEHLEALATALETDDVRLLQGATTTPPPLQCVQDWPVEGACALGYAFAACNRGFADNGKNQEAATVGDVEEFFAICCFECDQRLSELAGCRWWLNWWDETPRQEMFALMLPEIKRTLERRNASQEENRADARATA